jgi:hypothetical protein
MLTVLHPEVLPLVEDLSIGLMPLSIPGGDRHVLIVKAVKEGILAAKVNQGFKIYVSPVSIMGTETIGLVSAFFDDEDEPLTIRTPLFDDEASRGLVDLLKHSNLDIYFFDEHNREWLGYACEIECPAATKERLSSAWLCRFDLNLARTALNEMPRWFGLRSKADDLSALNIKFVESIFPDDYLVMDIRPDHHSYKGGPNFSFSRLIREEPGVFNEQDIAHLLKKQFLPEQIYMNPLRTTDKEEIADIIVVTDSNMIVIQAKDSPNTETSLRRTINRKRLAAQKAISNAVDQVHGAIRYLKSTSLVKMIVGGGTLELDVKLRKMHSLIVVKELFNDEYSEYTPPILSMAKETEVPCVVLDYPELRDYVTGLDNEESFIRALDRVFSHGIETGQFPRLRIWHSSLFSQNSDNTD